VTADFVAGDVLAGDFFVGDFLGAAFFAVLEALADFFAVAFVVDDVDAAVFFRTPFAAGESVAGDFLAGDFLVVDFFAEGVVGEDAAAFLGVGVVLPVGLSLLATVVASLGGGVRVCRRAVVDTACRTRPDVVVQKCPVGALSRDRSARSARSAVTEVPGRRTTGGG
jgi:hypothetical protein